MANTNKGRKFYVCATPQPTDLDLAAYEALTWVEVLHVGSVGDMGMDTNVVTYDELATEVSQKQKGISNAGDPVIECARSASDPGQLVLRTAAGTKFIYAFKLEDADAPSSGYTNTVYYNRGIVNGPARPGGRAEDFILENFTLGLVQKEVVKDPAAASAPVNSVLPAISGIAQTGQVLTAYEGSWSNSPTGFTYQWQHDAAGNGTFTNIVAGSTGKQFTAVVGDVGNRLRVIVTALNGAGSTPANSAPTVPQVA
jgi:hypothetical protein